MGYFNESYIATLKAKLASPGCPPGDYDAYNMVCQFDRARARAEVALYDAWRAPSAMQWYRIVTTEPILHQLVDAPANSSGDAGLVAAYRPLAPDVALYGYYAHMKGDVLELLRDAGAAAGLPPSFDWTPYLATAMKREFDRLVSIGGNPLSLFGYALPLGQLVHVPLATLASELQASDPDAAKVLATAAANTAPGTEFWRQTEGVGQAINRERDKARMKRALTVVLGIATAGYLSTFNIGAGAAASSGGATVAEEAALLGIADTGASSSVALAGGGSVSSSLASSPEVFTSQAIAEEAAALGIGVSEVSPGVYQAIAPAAASSGAASAIGGAAEAVADAAVKLGKGVANTVAGTTAAKLAAEITGQGQGGASAGQAQPQAGAGGGLLQLAGLFLAGIALARGL